jgi:serine/threonine protein phosphatase PrpC
VNPRLEMTAATDRGMVRARNEDCVAARADAGLAIVADGMGGHNAGEVASRMAVEVITGGLAGAGGAERLDPKRAETLIAGEIARANRQIHDAGRARRDHAGMGTTVVVALWYETSLSVGHVGDSRLYRLRARELRQLTRDHTLVQDEVERGMLSPRRARAAPNRSILTRAVGSAAEVAPDLNTFKTMPDDIYLLCSDGLTEMLGDEEIAVVLGASPIGEAADTLVHEANARGGVDNISVVVARVGPPAAAGAAPSRADSAPRS